MWGKALLGPLRLSWHIRLSFLFPILSTERFQLAWQSFGGRQSWFKYHLFLSLASWFVASGFSSLNPCFLGKEGQGGKIEDQAYWRQVESLNLSWMLTPDEEISSNTGKNEPKLRRLLWGLHEMRFEKHLAASLVLGKQPSIESEPRGLRDSCGQSNYLRDSLHVPGRSENNNSIGTLQTRETGNSSFWWHKVCNPLKGSYFCFSIHVFFWEWN